MQIAIFADLHGRILLAFKLVDRYQRETGQNIDLILQCGDMGIFPNLANADKATLRHARADSTELGYSQWFLERDPMVEQLVSRVDANLLCVRGNHEDHVYLDSLEVASAASAFPVDCYRCVHVLKTGVVRQIGTKKCHLQLLGIGRTGPPVGEGDLVKAKYIQRYEQDRLLDLGDDRVAARQFFALLFQLPPRFTRFEPPWDKTPQYFQ